jgi:hypothetical protein
MPKEEKFNLEDALSEGFDKMAAEEEKPVVLETVAEIDNGTEVEVSEEEVEAGTETDEAQQVEAEGDQGAEEVTAEGEQVVAEEEPEYSEPAPERWTQEMKDAYQKIPPEARKLMVENVFKPMQRQYTENTTALSQMKEQITPVLKIMEEYSGAFKDGGANPVDAIRRQTAWAAHFEKVGAEQGMADMAKSFGVENVTGGQAQEEYLTPTERRLKSDLDNVNQKLDRQTQTAANQNDQAQQEAAQRRYNEVHGELRSFIGEQKDGKPLHPHVEQVAPQIAKLLKSGLVTRSDEFGQAVPYRDQFAQAYKMACDMTPSIRSAITPNARQRQVDKAKAAQNVGVVTTMSSKQEVKPELSVTDAVSQAFDQLERSG